MLRNIYEKLCNRRVSAHWMRYRTLHALTSLAVYLQIFSDSLRPTSCHDFWRYCKRNSKGFQKVLAYFHQLCSILFSSLLTLRCVSRMECTCKFLIHISWNCYLCVTSRCATVLVDCDMTKLSCTKLTNILNKPPWHISTFFRVIYFWLRGNVCLCTK